VHHIQVPDVRKVSVILSLGRGAVDLDGQPREWTRALGALWAEATKTHPADELALLLDLNDVDLSTQVGPHAGFVELQVPKEKVDVAFSLGRELLTEPTLHKKDVARWIRDRKVWLADSFAGLPTPDPERYPEDAFWQPWAGRLAVSEQQVRRNFEAYGLLDDQVRFLPGWFADTLPQAPPAPLALLRLDGDLYASTEVALRQLYPRLSPGGFVIIDDYYLTSCRQAVDDYRAAEAIEAELQPIDWTGVWWRKSAP
jgi:hypothetical protein